MKPSQKLMVILAALLFAQDARCLYAAEKIKIVATTSTFASLAGEITGEAAEIYYVASPNQNIHFITPTPKDVLKTKRADVFIHGGLDLEVWRAPLLNAVGKKDFLTGERSIDASEGVSLLEVPEHDHVLSRLDGDVHVYGNPHYWPAPENAKAIASGIAAKLSELYPEHKNEFLARAEDFKSRMDTKIKDWKTRMAPFKGTKIVTYHNSWVYFLDAFGLETLIHLEPKPGIPPTPKHLKHVIEKMKEHRVKVIVREVYEENRTPKKAAQETGAMVVTLPIEVGQIKGGYADLIENNIAELEKALKS
jgi:zinc/manganese transport system substrate-binding protein